ncbi:MAG: phosphatase PAP2 family protein [Planctomycetales bacterium]
MRSPIAVAACAALLFASKTAFADAVLDWNNAVLDSVRATRTAPPPATRAFAMMHLAIYDAVNGIEQTYEHYVVDFASVPPPDGASPEAAAATAAYTVLAELFPEREKKLQADLRRSLGQVGPGPARDDGMAWGAFCGETVLALRADDGADETVPYEPVAECGRWRPTPPGFGSPLFAQWAHLDPFAIESGDQFRVDPPPDCTSAAYAFAFEQVKELGAVDSTTRTEEETEIAYFWEDGPGSVTPPGRWQLIAQELAADFDLSLLDSARLFALLSMTQADAAIASWDAKYYYDHWRPVTGIRLADFDENEDTDLDPEWTPLIPTPSFPSYTSGHSTFSGGSAELLELFFDDRNLALDVRTPKPPIWPQQIAPAVRSYDSLREAAEEAGRSRIYGGIHWQYDNLAGLESGRALAEFVFDTYLQPLAE